MVDAVVFAELSKLWVIKLSTIVCDDGIRKIELTDDQPSHKIFGSSLSDLSNCFGFDPLG